MARCSRLSRQLGYASTPTTLVSFDGTNGETPVGSLIADSNGDLFGTTDGGGANDFGTVFEIAKTAGGYASTPTTLVSFAATMACSKGQSDRRRRRRPVRHDRRRRLRGARHGIRDCQDRRPATRARRPHWSVQRDDGISRRQPDRRRQRRPVRHDIGGGANDDGTVFEIAKTARRATPARPPHWSASTAQTARSPRRSDRRRQRRPVRRDRRGGANDEGTVFEITDSGFAYGAPRTAPDSNRRHPVAKHGRPGLDLGHERSTLVGGGPVSPNPGPSWTEIGTGDFNHDGHSDILWQNAAPAKPRSGR